jgi:desulfoferrodoxin (superoxide reductase-like protein)
MDTSLDSLLDYENAKWMANCTWMTPKEAKERFELTKEQCESLTVYKRTQDGIPGRLNRDNKSSFDFDGEEDVNLAVAIWEYWDKGTMTVYTWGEGGGFWIKDPFHPNRMGERWCPFFILGLNWIDGQEWPVSEVELLMSLQDEYNTVREQMAKHRELSAPFFIADSSRVNYEDIETFSNATIGDIALINAGGTGVNTVFQPAQVPPMNYQVYDTTPIRSDIEWISGLGDAQRGGIMRAKTATEANIQNEGLATRVSEKIDAVEMWLKDISKFSSQLLIQEVSPQKAVEIAGPHAFWPILNKQHLYDSIYIQITAGSTAMPNENEERMRWIELMPIIMQNVQMVQQLRDVGVPDEFNPYVQLLEETFKRFDERIDVSKFMPPLPDQMQEQVMQNQIMKSLMMGGKDQQQNPGPPGMKMPSDMTQQFNETRNVPNNRVDQRERNQYRQPS